MRSKSTLSRSKAPCLAHKSVKEMFKPIKKTRQNCDLKASTPTASNILTSSPVKSDRSIIKRNLFGIRLNHDQLNRDLKEMWREQIEKQKQQWNFDFEKLKPVNLNRSSKSLNDLSLNDSTRYDWIRVNTYYAPAMSGYSPSLQSISLPDHLLDDSMGNTDFVISAFDKNEIDYEHKLYKEESSIEEEETETEEEEDDALAVPQFYKYQRRLKLMKETTSKNDTDKENKKIQNGKVTKPKRVLTRRRASNGQSEGQKLTQSLIITFSENRKDTLRSAHNMTSGINKMDEKKDNMKQQSLLDLFKQRKRKTSGSQ